MPQNVVTRFAPSPTGFLHIGGARTALFNWLYAKANGGKMLLRIEDTDRSRSTEEAIDAIMDGMKWLGLDWDDEPHFQYAGADRHRQVAHEMVSNGSAYKCTCTAEELTAMRERAQAEGHPPHYDGTCRDRDPKSISPDTPYVIRLKTPLEGETVVNDKVQGLVRFPNKDLDDLILLRSDGNPTYMLAVVVDDHDMGITHIIRGDDHLTNAAKQTLIFEGMGWSVPDMAHIPLIHGADGAKLSKRHGAIGAEKYRAMGYLPDALCNYLVRLGWAHGDDEIISRSQMVDWFGFDGMNKAASRFDFAKLDAINGHYIRNCEDGQLLETMLDVLREADPNSIVLKGLNEETRTMLLRGMSAFKERAKTLVDLADKASFIFATLPLPMEDKAAKLLDEDGKNVVAGMIPELEKITDWTPENIEAAIRGYAEEQDLKLGKVAQPLRAAVTGLATSPGAFDVLRILGKHEALSRLKHTV